MPLTLDLPADVDWSVHVVDTTSGQVLAAREETRLLSTASVGKVFVLIEVARRLLDGSLSPTLELDRRWVPRVTDSGVWHRLSTDTLPLVDAATLVGSVSDNWATNVLVDLVGLDAVRAVAQGWAPHGSALVDVVRGLRGPADPPHLSLGCALDHTGVLTRLHRDDEPVGPVVLGWLRGGVDHSMVIAAFGQDPLAHDEDPFGPAVVNKTGTNLGVRADVGLVSGDGRTIAYAAIANWHEDPPGRRRAEVLAALRAIGAGIGGLLP